VQGLPEKTFAARVASAIVNWRPDMTWVDTTGGYGGEVVSRLRDGGHLVEPVVFSWKASDERFANLRAEMYFKLANWIKEGGAIPPDPALISELCAPTYSNDNAANRLTLESKDDIRKRLGVSPDLADALAITFSFSVVKLAGVDGRGVGHALTDYDEMAYAERTVRGYDPFREER
jgi:hypothetical protein